MRIGVSKGDTRSLDYSSRKAGGLGFIGFRVPSRGLRLVPLGL